MDQQYARKLEEIIKQMLRPLKGIPLNLVIQSISGHRIISFNKNDSKDRKVLDDLKKVANIAGSAANKVGILRKRANEVGNAIEPFVKSALSEIGYEADTPLSRTGKRKATGYPDIEFIDSFGRINYLECKSFNIDNIATTQRAFYLSPSEDFKITTDAHHFVISFEVYVARSRKGKNLYKFRTWKILSIEDLEVDVKYEFNSDNARLYIPESILAEGSL